MMLITCVFRRRGLTFEFGAPKLFHGRTMLYAMHSLCDLVHSSVKSWALQQLLQENRQQLRLCAETQWWQ
jgi:hypothetical protein